MAQNSCVPKVAHFYWGNTFLSYLRYLTIISFKKFHPDWEIKVYYPKQFCSKITWGSGEQNYTLKGENFTSKLHTEPGVQFIECDMAQIGFSNSLPEVIKSDVFRWHLLSTEGGLWSDMDILYFDSVHRYLQEFETYICYHNKIFSIGFLAASPNNAFFQSLFLNAKKYLNDTQYQSVGCMMVQSMYPDLHAIYNSFQSVFNIPMDVVYSIPSHRLEVLSQKSFNFPPAAIGVHWYAGSKQSVGIQNSISPNNTNNNVIGQVVRMINL